MRRHTSSFLALTLAFALAGCGQADSAPADSAERTSAAAVEPPPVYVPAGYVLTFTVDQQISTKSTKAGDAFTAHLVGEARSQSGELLLPAGTVLHGRVTESFQSPSNEDPAVILLAVESLETPSGTKAVVAGVEEVQMETDAQDTNKLSAVKVLGGTAAGAIIGKIAGRTKTGAAVGTAAGAALAIATRDGHATIPAGAQMVVRMTERLAVR
jgi:hypothetical protein